MSAIRRHPLVAFFVLTYVLSWWPVPFGGFIPAGPLVAALIVISITQGLSGLKELGSRMIRWRVKWYWCALAIGLPLAVHFVTVVLNVGLGAPAPSLAQFSSFSRLIVVFAVPLKGAIQTEAFWSAGAAAARMSLLYGAVWCAVAIGLVIFDWQLRRGVAPASATVQPAYGGESRRVR